MYSLVLVLTRHPLIRLSLISPNISDITGRQAPFTRDASNPRIMSVISSPSAKRNWGKWIKHGSMILLKNKHQKPTFSFWHYFWQNWIFVQVLWFFKISYYSIYGLLPYIFPVGNNSLVNYFFKIPPNTKINYVCMRKTQLSYILLTIP